ncbi:phosphotransferase [Naumannella halotolerans]|uniref:maltokinase N-terminal cap-like domain-containing protein n=1 Tax=Naumannella halotolerans TaxID=993414 RepID=UPI00370DAC0B
MTSIGTPSPLPTTGLADYLATARWFGGKGRDFEVTWVTRIGELPTDQPDLRVVIDVVHVHYADGDTELYQLPLALYSQPQENLGHAFISWHNEAPEGEPEQWRHAYDAIHDRAAMACWLAGFQSTDVVGAGTGAIGLQFHLEPGCELSSEAQSSPFTGEQSNSSVMFGDDALLKIFRKLTRGMNPDIEILDVLTQDHSEHVARLYGWLSWDTEEEPLQLAILQQFLKTASDGWELALTSVRNLFAEAAWSAEGEMDANQAGGDFADEAYRLGAALASVHRALAEHFGTTERTAEGVAELIARMRGRLAEAVVAVPELAEFAPGLTELYQGLATLPGTPTQRIHGDLHLGQTLRTVNGWKLVDFEGEPAKPLPQRRQADSRWRDVAGMLRSFDYAAHSVVMTEVSADLSDEGERELQATGWAARNQQAFLDGYTEEQELTPTESALLAAYVADKAVYEAVYEARNRPSWLGIPLAALGRLG